MPSQAQIVDELHSIDAEMMLLGALFADNRLVARTREITTPSDFSDPFLGRVFAAMCRLLDEGMIANVITLMPEMSADALFAANPKGAGPMLAKISSYAMSRDPDTILGYASHIHDLALRREMLDLLQSVINRTRDTSQASVEELLEQTLRDIASIVPTTSTSAKQDRDTAESVVNRILSPPPCFPSGLPNTDDAMGGGFFAGKFYGLGARKKAGKTMMLSSISYNLVRSGVPHLFVSLEMDDHEIEQRKAARFLGINPIAFLRNPSRRLAEQTAEYQAQLSGTCWYEHRPGLTREELLTIIARSHLQRGIKGVIVDYQQLVRGRGERVSQAEHQEQVAQDVADMCRKLGIFGVMAAQLNTEGNTRGGEGLRLACDLYWVLHREDPQSKLAWLEMQDARYVTYTNVGDQAVPGLYLHHGAFFSEDPLKAEE